MYAQHAITLMEVKNNSNFSQILFLQGMSNKQQPMASFPIQMQQYDNLEVEDAIADLDAEMADEEQLRATLSTDSVEKIDQAKEFMKLQKETILDQHSRLLTLNLGLRAIVKNNKDKQAADAEYNALVNSEEYTEIAHKMSEIKAIVNDLRAFLIAEGVRGRPPTAESD